VALIVIVLSAIRLLKHREVRRARDLNILILKIDLYIMFVL